MNSCTIAIGSNTPDREAQVKSAIDNLSSVLDRAAVSSVYDTPAISGDGTTYTNAVIHGYTSLRSDQLVTLLKDRESMQGRDRTAPTPHSEVAIDLDLVIYASRILREADFSRHYFNIGYRELLAAGTYQDE